MTDPEVGKRVKELAWQLQRILKDNLLRDHRETDAAMARASEIRNEIEALGFLVTWSASFIHDGKDFDVVVDVYEVRDDLTPEDRKIYNQWLIEANLRKNRMKPGTQEP